MDKVIIQNLRVRGILGIHDWERVIPREIIINATMFTDTHPAAQSDDISNCVNYSDMAKKLRAHAESAARMTIEALANDLAEIPEIAADVAAIMEAIQAEAQRRTLKVTQPTPALG